MKTTHTTDAIRFEHGRHSSVRETLTAEAALQIRINGVPFTTTLRTPGHDDDLVRGLLFTEAIVPHRTAPLILKTIPDPETGIAACVDVEVDDALLEVEFRDRRSLIATSSCGLCGTRELKDLDVLGPPVKLRPCRSLRIDALSVMLDRMAQSQETFRHSGGCHAAAAFSDAGQLLALREDVGRHNAVDKTIGALLCSGQLDEAGIMFVSGRISYEIVLKSYRAAFPVLAAVSAPSSFAVQSAQRFGMTLAGFCRDHRATIYAHPHRIQPGSAS